MKPGPLLIGMLKGVLLVALYALLFSVGGQLFAHPSIPALKPEEQSQALAALGVVAVVDVSILVGVVLTSRLRGWRLWLLTVAVFYGGKTLLSMVEAWYFMKNVTPEMLPGLVAMTLPALVVTPLVAILLFHRWADGGEQPAWQFSSFTPAQWVARVAVLSVVVYPVLFFGFGYFVAWQSPALREFYGGTEMVGLVEHMRRMVTTDPWVFPFEWVRGALWVALALALIGSTRGGGWLGGLWAVLVFSLVQNDVHLMPNPLMPAEVRQLHFLETATSNAINALIITWLAGATHALTHRGVSTGNPHLPAAV